MTAQADQILERRRLRQRLAFWRILAIVAVVIGIISLLPRSAVVSGPHVARVTITGMIRHDPARERLILDLAERDAAKAVIVSIDSPGGTLVGSEALYEAIRKVAAEKPVVALMGEYAASGGYVVALAADHIVARRNSLTGSIGVVLIAPNVEGLLDMAGVEVTQIRSAPLKAEPSMFARPTEAGLAAQEDLIDDGFQWFRDLVRDRRGLDADALARAANGRAYTGGQAIELGLVDVLGDEATARDWLAETHEIDRDLPIFDVSTKRSPVPIDLKKLGLPSLWPDEIDNLLIGTPQLSAVIQ